MSKRAIVSFLSVFLLAGTAAVAGAQEPPPTPPPAAQQAAQPTQPTEPAIGFTSDAGMMFNVIKAVHSADFEMVLGRLKEALQKSEDPLRKLQAASWRIYKSTDPAEDGNVLYIFMFDEAVKGADYDPVKILSEAFPTEVNALYEKLTAAYSSLNKAGLAKVMNMAPAGMKEIQ